MALRALGLTGVFGCETSAAEHILALRYGLKVVGVDAASYPTQVVDNEVVTDRSMDFDVREPVSSCLVTRARNAGYAIAVLAEARPDPAGGLVPAILSHPMALHAAALKSRSVARLAS